MTHEPSVGRLGPDPTAASDPSSPPVTGNARVDAATSGLGDLREAPLSEHAARLQQVQDALASVLETRDTPQQPIPGVFQR